MPLFYYHCPDCDKALKRLFDASEAKKPQRCPNCDGTLVRTPKLASSQVMETLDNGLMARKVVRPADAERIFAERSQKKTVEGFDEND